MLIKEQKSGGVSVVGLCGRLDGSSSEGVETKIMGLLEKGERRLVIDFSELSYVSSVGLRALISVAKEMDRLKGKIALSALSQHIHEIFKIAGFTRIFPIYPTCDEAVAHCVAGGCSESGSSTRDGSSLSGEPARG